MMKGGTIIDATIIEAPSSTKNGSHERDPEMSSTEKGANYHFEDCHIATFWGRVNVV